MVELDSFVIFFFIGKVCSPSEAWSGQPHQTEVQPWQHVRFQRGCLSRFQGISAAY